MNDLNPGVERAVAAAGDKPSVTDWLRILLADEEGRPAVLLGRHGLDSNAILLQLRGAESSLLPTDDLLRRAREHSIRLKADPTFTTDFLMLAALHHEPSLAETLGIQLDRLDELLRSPLVAGPSLPATPATPFEVPDVTDRSDAARIVDASLNRAREALRVLDDYARFVRNDSGLSESLKLLRHRLADVARHLPLAQLLAARDTPRDVGTRLAAPEEYHRDTPEQVAIVNFKRLQESLRSIEEFGKLLSPAAARDVEAIRYECYALEAALVGGSPLRERLQAARLYVLLSGEGCEASLEWTLAEAAAGGARIVQLREKQLGDRELLSRARQVRQWTRDANMLFIVNDRPDIARLADADGVHLGQEDMPVADARRILGPKPLIGVSTHTVEQVRCAVRDGADYLGIGPCFPSRTKAFESLAGVEFITAAVAETSLPMFALGGIDATTLPKAVAAGARRIAVSAAIAQADDPRLAAIQLLNLLPE